MEKKNAFTLIELLAVIIILAVIALIATPVILNVVDNTKESARRSSVVGYAEAVRLGVYDKLSETSTYPEVTKEWAANKENVNYKGQAVDCRGVYFSEEVGVILDSCQIDDSETYYFASGKVYLENDENFIKEYKSKLVKVKQYEDGIVNKPQLMNNMIPVRYENDNWVYIDATEKWYDYDNKEWANVVVLNKGVTKEIGDIIDVDTEVALMYVWIPRYKYTLFNSHNGSVEEQEIKITFEQGTNTTGTVKCIDAVNGEDKTISEICTDETNGEIIDGTSTYTHPAFTLGAKELTGFWIGKFETSTTDEACLTTPNLANCNKSSLPVTIKPNVQSLNFITMGNARNLQMTINEQYSINGDSHLLRNMEWGAVAYLTHSKYGRCANGVCIKVYINNAKNTGTPSRFIAGRSGGAPSGETEDVATHFPDSEDTSTNKYYTYGYYTYDGKIIHYDGTIGDYANDRTLGTNASTTGNIYGVYDMSGGTNEWVAGQQVLSSSATKPDDIYVDYYTYGTDFKVHSRGKLGDATKETLKIYGSTNGGWYGNASNFPSSNSRYIHRGGDAIASLTPGVLCFRRDNNRNNPIIGSRAALSAE